MMLWRPPRRPEGDQAKASRLLAWNISSIGAFVFRGSLIPMQDALGLVFIDDKGLDAYLQFSLSSPWALTYHTLV